MKKTTIKAVIVKSKVLKDGSHKVRISVAHNNETRYITTDVSIPSEKNFRKGEVIGLPNASYINRKLRKSIDDYYGICEGIQGIEYVTCSRLVDILCNGGLKESVLFKDIANEWVEMKLRTAGSTKDLYKTYISQFVDFMGESFPLSALTPLVVNRYIRHLSQIGNNDITIDHKITALKGIVRFATVKRNYVTFKIDPFADYVAPPPHSRDVALTVDELRTLRDFCFKRKCHKVTQAYFMLSFYMCGMNAVDIAKVDFSKDEIKFKRQKTERRIPQNQWTVFSIPKEAKDVARSGQLELTRRTTTVYKSITNKMRANLDNMRELALPDRERLIYYSARKTFAQLAAELGISDSTIEYCIGDSQSQKKAIDYYRHVTKEMADNAIRLVLDFVASDKSMPDFKKERNLQ